MNYHRDNHEISQSQTILMPGTLAYAQDSFFSEGFKLRLAYAMTLSTPS